MEGHCSADQSPQWAVVTVEEEEEEEEEEGERKEVEEEEEEEEGETAYRQHRRCIMPQAVNSV